MRLRFQDIDIKKMRFDKLGSGDVFVSDLDHFIQRLVFMKIENPSHERFNAVNLDSGKTIHVDNADFVYFVPSVVELSIVDS